MKYNVNQWTHNHFIDERLQQKQMSTSYEV